MGCDIHWYSETRKDGKWVCDQASSFEVLVDDDGYLEMDSFPNRHRDYRLFGLLAGVRTEFDYSYEPYGFPEAASKEVTDIYKQWDVDAHTPSHLTRAQLVEKFESLKPIRTELLLDTTTEQWEGEAASHFTGKLQEIISHLDNPVPDEDQRLVFWFDN